MKTYVLPQMKAEQSEQIQKRTNRIYGIENRVIMMERFLTLLFYPHTHLALYYTIR